LQISATKLHDRQAGNHLEVAEIAGGDAIAEFQCRDADQKIGEWKAHTFGLILTVDLPAAKSDHHRDRMNGQGRKQFMNEMLPLFLL
jgi:hypothetical protein